NEMGNSKIKFVRFPAWPLFLAADVCEAMCKPLGLSPPLYRRRVAFFTKDRAFDTRKLREVLEYQSSVETETGLRSTARWYREHSWI
ncbi:MAG: NAD(P)-dependent oxidoreductase, partial [Alphaproteobacteria bacterium]